MGHPRAHLEDVAILIGELEDTGDGRLVGSTAEGDPEGQKTALGVEWLAVGRLEATDGRDMDDLAEGAQVTQKRQRVHSVAEGVAFELQLDHPEIAHDRQELLLLILIASRQGARSSFRGW